MVKSQRVRTFGIAIVASMIILGAVLALAAATGCAGDVVEINGTQITVPQTAVVSVATAKPAAVVEAVPTATPRITAVTWQATAGEAKGGWLRYSVEDRVDIGGALKETARVGEWRGAGPADIRLSELPRGHRWALKRGDPVDVYLVFDDGPEVRMPNPPSRAVFVTDLAGFNVNAGDGVPWTVQLHDLGAIEP